MMNIKSLQNDTVDVCIFSVITPKTMIIHVHTEPSSNSKIYYVQVSKRSHASSLKPLCIVSWPERDCFLQIW